MASSNESTVLGLSLSAYTDAQLKSALLYLDERIDGMQNQRRIIADEIDRRAAELSQRIADLRREDVERRTSGEIDP